jgi:hypothetical protein
MTRITARPSPALTHGPARRIRHQRRATPSPLAILRARMTMYRALRHVAGPVVAYRLSLAWRAAS